MIIRILCGIGDPDTARALTALLGQIPTTEPAQVVTDSTAMTAQLGHLAEESVEELPEVVLVHERIGPMPALELVRDVAMRFPAVGVVLMSQAPTPDLYAAAMDVGARGVVGLPLSYDELASRVQTAAAWASGVRRHLSPGGGEAPAGPGGTLVTVTGAKGGVGASVTAVQLALAARAAGRSTALVDMDLQSGDLASYLEVQFRRSIADLADINDISPRVLQEAMFTHPTGLSLLLAPAEGERGEDVTDRAARQIVGALRARFEVVVVDCGAQLGGASAVAVETADTAVLVATPDVVAVRAAKRMVRMWDRLQIRKAEDTVLVLNRHTRATEIQPALVERITGTKVARTTVPAAYRELQPVVDAGRLHDLETRSAVKQALWTLAGDLGILQAKGANGAAAGGRRAARHQARQSRRRGLFGGDRGNGDRAVGDRTGGDPAGGERAGGDQGQATIEFLGMFPIMLIVLAVIWQCLLIGYTFTLAGNVADKAARAAATGHDCAAAGKADLPSAWKGDVSCSTTGTETHATVVLHVPVLFPGAASFPMDVHGTAGAADEDQP
jgi:pilus assembly protein CpaE